MPKRTLNNNDSPLFQKQRINQKTVDMLSPARMETVYEHTISLLQQGARNSVPKSTELNDDSSVAFNEIGAIPRGQHSITSFGIRIEGRSRTDHESAGGSSSSNGCSSSSLRQSRDCAGTSRALAVQSHSKLQSISAGGAHTSVGNCASCNSANVLSLSRCTFCDRRSCAVCQRTCSLCHNQFCSLCSVLNYDTCSDETAYCLQCVPQ